MADQKDIAALVRGILDELQKMKDTLPNSELKVMQNNLEELRVNQKSMKEDISEMKKKLLDPNDGVIVKVNENTKFRLQEEDRFEDYMKINADVQDLKKWQGGVNKALWIIFGTLIAIGVKVVFGGKI
jgi:hypothetical protein